jgi:hypothetical protein
MTVLTVLVVWLGLSGATAIGWSRFFQRTKPFPLPRATSVRLSDPEGLETAHGEVA